MGWEGKQGPESVAARTWVDDRFGSGCDAFLEAIVRPAMILGADGGILTANAAARAILGADACGARPFVAPPMTSGERHLLAAGASPRVWDLTPLRASAALGFLAVLRDPQSEPGPEAAVEAARRRWKLTARQAEVLALVARGLTNQLIADSLGIRNGTVERHLSVVFDKAGVSNRATLIARVLATDEGDKK